MHETSRFSVLKFDYDAFTVKDVMFSDKAICTGIKVNIEIAVFLDV